MPGRNWKGHVKAVQQDKAPDTAAPGAPSIQQQQQEQQQQQGQQDPFPSWTVKAIGGLSSMMVVWILGFPTSTFYSGLWPEHGAWLDSLVAQYGAIDTLPVPHDILSKHTGQTAVVLLHHLPGAVWAACVPLQLNSTLRAKTPRLHRWLGYATAASAITLSSGVVLMEQKGMMSIHVNSQLAVTAWFLLSLFLAVTAARNRDYVTHRQWMLRHVAAGIWVALQRVFVGVLSVGGQVNLIDWQAAGEEGRVYAFGSCSVAAVIICFGTVEALLWQERSRQAAVKVKGP